MLHGFSKRILLFLLLPLVLGQYGFVASEAIPDEFDAEIKTVGIVFQRPTSESALSLSFLGRAGRGARLGSVHGASAGAVVGIPALSNPGGIILWPALVAAGAIVGTATGFVYGAVTSEPAENTSEPERIIRSALTQLHTPERLSEFMGAISQYGTNWTDHAFLHFADQSISEDNLISTYRSLAEKGIDAVLEITEPEVALLDDEMTINDPAQRLTMIVGARLVRLGQGRERGLRLQGWRITVVEGRARHIKEWAAEDAKQFRAEYTRVLESLSQAIVTEVFLLYRIPPQQSLGWENAQGGTSEPR